MECQGSPYPFWLEPTIDLYKFCGCFLLSSSSYTHSTVMREKSRNCFLPLCRHTIKSRCLLILQRIRCLNQFFLSKQKNSWRDDGKTACSLPRLVGKNDVFPVSRVRTELGTKLAHHHLVAQSPWIVVDISPDIFPFQPFLRAMDLLNFLFSASFSSNAASVAFARIFTSSPR